MYTKKRDEKANDKRQAMFNKHAPNKFNKDSNKPRSFSKDGDKPRSFSKGSDKFVKGGPKKF
jgi:hypothetical protein